MKQAKNITKKDLWGNYLYNIFKNYLTKEGWLLENKVADILENNLSNFDENFKTTNKLKKAYLIIMIWKWFYFKKIAKKSILLRKNNNFNKKVLVI